jgi:hypothetical protein
MYPVNQYTDDLAKRPGDLENGRSDMSDPGFDGPCATSRAASLACAALRTFEFPRAAPLRLPSLRDNVSNQVIL